MTPSLAAPPAAVTRLLGLVGILGGFALVAVFVPPIPWNADLFNLRLVAFNAGAIAIALALHRRHSVESPALALAGTAPIVAANAWYMVMVLRLVSAPGQPGPGDYGPLFDVAAACMWLADAWFGFVVARLGIFPRWAGAALTLGSLLAFAGMDRLGLASGPLASIVVPVALAGIAINGLAWIALGFDLARSRRTIRPA
jgi:hypothetical protein